MKCLIIAAGHGSRLRARSESKPLTPVNGTPLIEHVAAAAAAAGATGFVVVTGHRAAQVEAFLAQLSARTGLPIQAVCTADWNRPNGLSVLTGAALIEGDYLLLMADHLFDPAIARRLIEAGTAGAALRLAVDADLDGPNIDLDDATRVEIGADGAILAIGKTLDSFSAIDTGIFLATPALAEAIEASVAAGGAGSLSDGVQRLADEGRALTMEIGGAWWIDVDDPAFLQRAEEQLAARADIVTSARA